MGTELRDIEQLINSEDPGWPVVLEWKKQATNQVEVLEKDPKRNRKALHQTQVTTRSPMGAIIYESGGILVDHGWIRIFGSGCDSFTRSLPTWNKDRNEAKPGQPPSFLLIADDAIGGFFAINGGKFGKDSLGKVHYFAPDTLKWENLKMGYSQFIVWAFQGDLEKFYQGFRWQGWEKDVKAMGPDKSMSFFPFLWTKYSDFEKLSRKPVPTSETWSLSQDVVKQLDSK